VWGTTYLAIRVGLETIPVALFGGLRWTAAGTVLIAALRIAGVPLPPFSSWGRIAIAGVFMIVFGNGFVVWAEQYVNSGLTAVIIAVVPFWTVVVEAVIPGGERLTRRSLAGLALGFVGIVVLVWPEVSIGGGAGRLFFAGVIALQIACLGWAVGTAFTRRSASAASPLAASAVQMLLSGIMMTAIGTATGEWSRLAFSTRSANALIYLSLFGSIVAYSSYVYALKYLPLSLVSQYAYVNPIIAVIVGALFLNEPLSFRTVVAAVFVLSGIAVVRQKASGFRPQASGLGKALGPRSENSKLAQP
jgi:drug/metabolite transporter (DMT)-like permease